MVSSKLRNLEKLFNTLKNTTVDINDYKEEHIIDVICEIYTADGFVAGIADTLLDGKNVNPSFYTELSSTLLKDKKYWIMRDGREIDISEYEEILEYAEIIEETRKECYSILISKVGKLEGL